jgi:hypothetical protein
MDKWVKTMHKLLWNLIQQSRGILQKPPIDCHYVVNQCTVFCLGCEPGHVFQCIQCERLVSWCNGSTDSELCDRCWNETRDYDTTLLEDARYDDD